MRFKARTHYGGDMNTLFCQPASVDGDGEDAEERVQRYRSPITRASVHFMAVNDFERKCLFSYTAMKKEKKGWIGLVESWRDRLTQCTS